MPAPRLQSIQRALESAAAQSQAAQEAWALEMGDHGPDHGPLMTSDPDTEALLDAAEAYDEMAPVQRTAKAAALGGTLGGISANRQRAQNGALKRVAHAASRGLI